MIIEEQKQIHFRVPTTLFEKFHSIFPGKGEKQDFFLRVVTEAVARFAPKDMAIRHLIDSIAGEEEEG